MRIRILPEAIEDLEFGADFYELKEQGLGAEFLEALAKDIDRLSVHGGVHRQIYGYHRSVSRRFPFAIYYLFDDSRVDVCAVIDCRQDNNQTAKRLTGR